MIPFSVHSVLWYGLLQLKLFFIRSSANDPENWVKKHTDYCEFREIRSRQFNDVRTADKLSVFF